MARSIFYLFLAEAVALSLAGGLADIISGVLAVQLLHFLVPALPVHLAWQYIGAAFALSLLIGLLAGVLPAIKAARLLPLEALRAE